MADRRTMDGLVPTERVALQYDVARGEVADEPQGSVTDLSDGPAGR